MLITLQFIAGFSRYAPEMEKRLRWYWRNPTDMSAWHIDETYVKVNGLICIAQLINVTILLISIFPLDVIPNQLIVFLQRF